MNNSENTLLFIFKNIKNYIFKNVNDSKMTTNTPKRFNVKIFPMSCKKASNLK